ncbi:MAG TPA: hypothetical protein VKB41_08350 [Steroidobacteraceae bacterium]|jgi:hypothetical protein|nr:hypothetical protein [Steroidobacteraceae bacterium]
MRTSIAALALTALLAAGTAAATLRVVELGIETSTLSVSLPDDISGSIAVTSCTTCKPMVLRLSPASRYFIGKSEVTYAEIRSLSRGGASRQLNIYYQVKGREITRLVVAGQRPAPAVQPQRKD